MSLRVAVTVSGPGVERLREALSRAAAEASTRDGHGVDRGVAVRDWHMIQKVIAACDAALPPDSGDESGGPTA